MSKPNVWSGMSGSRRKGPGGFWLDLDPTNDVVPGNRHITIAHGRDFGDVTPMRGVILGGGRQSLAVRVTVTPSIEAIESQR